MKIAFKRAEQSIKSKTQCAKIDAKTKELQKLGGDVARIEEFIKAILKRSRRAGRRR